MGINLSFEETVKVTVRCLKDGLIGPDEALENILDAAHNKCIDCENETVSNLKMALATIDRAVEDEMRGPEVAD